MTPPRLALAALAAALLAAGCGGGSDDEKEVRDALLRFLSATETKDVEALCRGVTDASRKMLDTIAKARVGADAECGDAPPAEGAGAVGQQALEAVESADVAIEGDTARVEAEGEEGRLTMRKAGDEWRLDLVNYPG
ncbi:MAG: hypothetical protein M3389_00830, partial [Actinomycetota bacterium]|nr:hypothetical protein [Actinomycetota bacterium]